MTALPLDGSSLIATLPPHGELLHVVTILEVILLHILFHVRVCPNKGRLQGGEGILSVDHISDPLIPRARNGTNTLPRIRRATKRPCVHRIIRVARLAVALVRIARLIALDLTLTLGFGLRFVRGFV